MNQRNFPHVPLFDLSNAIRSKSKQSNTMKKTLLIVTSILAPLVLQAEPTEGQDKAPKGERKGPPAEVIAKFDKDGDGELNEEERAAAHAEREKHHAEMIATYDTDKDGELSKSERKAMRIALFDADGDGTLNDTEKEAAKKEMMKHRGPRGEGKGKGAKGERKGPKKEEAADE